MRLPWSGRTERLAGAPAALPIARPARAWDQVPPLRAAVSVTPPLVGGAGEHSAAIGNRLRSTSVLVHRPRTGGAPMVPGVSGMMSGISTISSSAVVDALPAGDATAPRTASETIAAELPAVEPRAVPARPASEPTPSLMTLDATTASTLMPVRRALRPATLSGQVAVAPSVIFEEEPEVPQPPLGMPAPVPGRIVVRRRPQAGAPRPVGLQAPLDHVPVRTPAAAALAEPVVERVPERVAAAIQRVQGANVRELPVVRGDAASRLAASMHARAVTRGGEMFVPPERGVLDTAANRGLVAHELTHVLQQRRLGTDVPLEHTPAGRALEAQAVATEQAVRGDAGATPPPPEPSSLKSAQPGDTALETVRAVQDELTASGFATRVADGSLVFATPPMAGVQSGAPAQRAPDNPATGASPGDAPSTAESPSGARSGLWPSAGAPSGERSSPSSGGEPSSGAAAPVIVNQRSNAAAASPTAAPREGESITTTTVVTHESEAPPAPADHTASQDTDVMSRRLYDRLSARLRTELTLDRERAGLLTDLR